MIFDQNYRPGDVNIESVVIVSERGSIDLLGSVESMSVYESIFTPGIVCDIRVLDMNDLLGTVRLIGDETVSIVFEVLGSETAAYVFALHELAELESVGAQKGKSYTLKCVSEEAMHAKTNTIQKSYNLLCSEMIGDIHRNYLRSTKELVTESSSAPQRIVIPSMNPYDAISLIKRRAVSADRNSSLYCYFENRQNQQQTFNFVTIESLFDTDPVKDFQMSDAVNLTIRARGDDNILAFRVPHQFNSADRIAYGGPRRITTFNFTTWDFDSQIIQTSDATLGNVGGRGAFNSQAFQNRYFNNDNPPQSMIPVDISQRPSTQIPEATPNTQAMLALMLQNAIRIRVIGDTILTAGVTINCELPNRQSFTDGGQTDPLISGKILITRIHHKIAKASERPRYTCVVEGIKGRYEDSL